MKFFTSRYTAHLEEQLADLKKQLAEERQQHREDVQRLTAALNPVLLKLVTQQGQVQTSGVVAAAIEAQKPAHKITKAKDQKSASCLCGWHAENEDPAEMQTAIQEHHRSYFKPLQVNKARWTGPNGVRARLEAASAGEA